MPRAICDRCGFEYDLSELRKEWTGFMVCAEDFDTRPGNFRPAALRPEGLPLRNARPEPAPVWAAIDTFLYGSVSAPSAVAGGLYVGPGAGYRPLVGAVAGGSGASGSLRTVLALNGIVAATGAATGTIRVAVSLTGVVANVNALTGSFERSNALAGAMTGGGNWAGAMTVAARLTGAMTGSAALSGAMSKANLLAGSAAGMGSVSGAMTNSGSSQRQFQMSDLPADFKLFEWDWARNDLITLDGNNKVASIADTWAGRLASTPSAPDRRSLSTLNGVQALYKAGSGAGTAADAVLLSDLTGLPSGNADRYLGIACQCNDGILGGYRGNTANIYCFDTPFSPGLRFYYDTNRVTSQLSVNKALPHFYTAQHASSVTSLRVDGVDAGNYPATLATVLDMFGIVGAGPNTFYPMVGYSLYFIVGKRAPTQDERWRIEWWVATNKTKQPIANDNPYKNSPPMVAA